MRRIVSQAVALTTLLGASLTAQAAEKPLSDTLGGTFSGSIGAVSDYTFRGISQTNEAPAVQGNIDFLHNSGVKLGVWGSNVDFGDASSEFDLYAAYAKSFDKVSTEVGAVYYAYPGAKSSNDYDYAEIYGSAGYDLGWSAITASLYYSPEFFADSGSAYYPKLAVKFPLPKGFAIDGWVGHQWIEENAKYGVPDYTDWAAGVSYAIEDFTLKAQYIDTDLSSNECAADACSEKVVFSVSKAF